MSNPRVGLLDNNLNPFSNSNPLSNSISGVDYVPGQSGVDPMTESLQSIGYEHHEIHEGDHFFISGYDSFSNGQVKDFTIVTPNTAKWAHFTYNLEGTGALSFIIKEGATVDVAGTAITPINNNRNSSNTSVLTIRMGDTFTGEGTQIYGSYSGANKEAGIVTRSNEIILKQNTTYLFRVTNETTSANIISRNSEWYEHTSKN